MVSGADGVFVVLDHDDGVAQIAQAFERLKQPVVVALVQADGGLIKDIEHARKPAPDLRGQAGCAGSRRPKGCRWCDQG